MRKTLATLILIGLVYAGGVGTTGANYLKIGLGAKASALGENFTALANDTSAVYWNAAGLSSIEKTKVDFMQLSWVAGISAKTFSGAYPISETDSIGGYLFMLDTPTDKETKYSSDGTVAYEETGNNFKSGVTVMDIAYAKKITKAFSVGLGVKAIVEDLAGEKANGFALDAGVKYSDLYPNLVLGASIQNMAINKLRQDEDLPMTTAFGAMYTIQLYNNKLNLLTDLRLPNDNDPRVGVGAEYWVGDMFAGRVGYNTFSQFSMGVGVYLQNLNADYAYVPLGDLGVTHRISLGYAFDATMASGIINNKEVIAPVEAPKPVNVDQLFEEEKPVIPTAETITTTEASVALPTVNEAVTMAVEAVATPEVSQTVVTENQTTSADILQKFDF